MVFASKTLSECARKHTHTRRTRAHMQSERERERVCVCVRERERETSSHIKSHAEEFPAGNRIVDVISMKRKIYSHALLRAIHSTPTIGLTLESS